MVFHDNFGVQCVQNSFTYTKPAIYPLKSRIHILSIWICLYTYTVYTYV